MTNIAVVVLDTVRYDHFNRFFDWLDGITFSNAYSTSHWTVPAHASLFTGQYASNVGVTGQAPTLDCDGETLPEALQREGYRTTALSANAQLNQYDGWDRGFDTFDRSANLGRGDEQLLDWDALIRDTEPGVRRHLKALIRCVHPNVDTVRSLRYGYDLFQRPQYDGGMQAIKDRLSTMEFGEQEFLFINVMEAHTPYRPPPGEKAAETVVVAEALANSVEQPERLRAAYQESVRYLSNTYEAVHQRLLDSFDFIITLADHGELLGEHGLWNHSISLHPELLHIPVVISGRSLQPERRDEPVNILDIHRTVCDLAEIRFESEGRSLLSPVEPRELLFESHGVLPFHRGQFERHNIPESELQKWQTPMHGFITQDGAYCYETEPGSVVCLGDTELSDPVTRHRNLGTQLELTRDQHSSVDVSAEVKARLEELGYA